MRTLIIATLMATGCFSTSIYAQDSRAGSTAKVQWLSIPEVHAKLESAGYRNIEKIERERGSYEVKVTDRNGQRMKLFVHPQTGEVLEQRTRDVNRDKSESGYAKSTPRNMADCNERRCRDDLPQKETIQPAAGK